MARHTLEEEFREFVAARSAALLRTAYLLAGDWATAEDLLQIALTKTYLAWKRLGGIEAVEPYARRVLVNTATSWWRRRWHGERPTEVLPDRSAPDQIEEQLERDALWRHVQTLPVRQRAVLVLRFYEDLSETQTAELLNISTGTVKSQTSRALKTLRRRLGAETAAQDPVRDPTVALGDAPAATAPAAGRNHPPAVPATQARPPAAEAASDRPPAAEAASGRPAAAPGGPRRAEGTAGGPRRVAGAPAGSPHPAAAGRPATTRRSGGVTTIHPRSSVTRP